MNKQLKATPENEDFGHKYTEEGQGRVGGWLLSRYFMAVQTLLDAASVDQNESISAIEIGCGEGYSTQKLKTICSSDINLMASEFVSGSVSKAQDLNPGVKVIQESVYELTHDNDSFEVVFLLEVLEHLDYPDDALREIARTIKPNGALILGVPREPLWRFLNMLRGKYLKDFGNTVGHLNHWSARGLVKLMNENGWTVVQKRMPIPWTIVLAKKNED